MDDILTSGRVAKICGVAPRTANKWIDAGKLAGYKIPGGDRRVLRADLVAFLKANGMPLGELAHDGRPRLLIVGWDQGLADRLRELLPDYCHEEAGGAFEAGLALAQGPPEVAVVDGGIGRSEALRILRTLRSRWALLGLIALPNEDEECPEELAGALANVVIRKPCAAAEVAGFVRRLVAATSKCLDRPRSSRVPRNRHQTAAAAG